MKAMMSLAWKEWHEARTFLWIALGIFVLLPIAGGIEETFQSPGRFEIAASPWVVIFGGVLAIFVAVGATCRDFSGHLEDFWRSRPVSVTRWLFVKYLVGLAVVLLACTIPLIIELGFNREKTGLLLLAWFPFLWAALYGIGFLSGCLIRRPAHAAMLALAAMLLVYFLPVVLPPLQWLNVSVITDMPISPLNQRISPGHDWPEVMDPTRLAFAGGMLGLAILVLILSLLAVRRDWRIDSGRKMMYGSISAVVLILFASAAFQLGTNMPILRQIDVSKDDPIWQIQSDGNDTYAIIRRSRLSRVDANSFFRSIKLTDSSIELGSPIWLDDTFQWGLTWDQQPAPANPRIVYHLADRGDDKKRVIWLYVAQLDKTIDKPVLHILDYVPYSSDETWTHLYAMGNRLYVFGGKLITLDITQPLSPRVISEVPFGYPAGWDHFGGDTFTFILPPIPDLSARQRLEAAVRPFCFEADTLCFWSGSDGSALFAYHLTQLTNDKAVFKKIGQYETTMLESLFGSRNFFGGIKLQNGLLYVSEGYAGRLGNPHIDVFDTRGPHPLRLIGHFAAPGVHTVMPLPDGTALVGGDKLWLIGPPPH